VDHFYYVSGHGPVLNDGSLIVGRVGDAMDMEEGKLAVKGYPLDLSILLSGGKETKRDSPSNGERRGKSPSLNRVGLG